MKHKSIISILLVAVMALGLLSGCGSGTEPAAATPEELITTQDISEIQKEELLYMAELGFSMENIKQETISGKEMTELLDKLVEYAALEKLEEWKDLYPAFRSTGKDLKRIDVLSALFLAVQHIGGDYRYYKVAFDDPMYAVLFADQEIAPDFDLFGGIINFDLEGWGNDHYGVGGYHYNITRKSPIDNEYPLAYDEESKSFRMYENATYLEAMLSVIRAIRIGESKTIVSIDDPAAITPNKNILTDELIAKANNNPTVTSEDHPRWTGFMLGLGNAGELGTSADDITLSGEWGFNAAKLLLHYETLFSADMTSADISMLEKLDELVAAAIEQDMHLNIMLHHLPGHKFTIDENYVSHGEFDLFTNEAQQIKADHVFRILAARYKDIPNYNLSIAPLYGASNRGMSTGLPSPEYTAEDVAAYLGRVIDVIRTEDADRLVIYEADSNNDTYSILHRSAPVKAVADEKGNTMISYNFCQSAYVYASMTSTEGRHIDDANSSFYAPSYPNYIYSIRSHICQGSSLAFDGLLPKGTVLTLHLEKSDGGTLLIAADGETLYSEELPKATYEIGDRISGYYPYAVSEKQIQIILPTTPKNLEIACKGGSFDLCGINLTLPEEYAVDRWYYAQAYDVYLGLEEETGIVKKHTSDILLAPYAPDETMGGFVTIYDNLSYSTDHILDEASEDTIYAWAEEIADFDSNCVCAYECADFAGTTWLSMKAYYEDMLKAFTEYGFGWFSPDWGIMTEEYPKTKIAECPSIEYAGYGHFNLELLQLLQKYQSKD